MYTKTDILTELAKAVGVANADELVPLIEKNLNKVVKILKGSDVEILSRDMSSLRLDADGREMFQTFHKSFPGKGRRELLDMVRKTQNSELLRKG